MIKKKYYSVMADLDGLDESLIEEINHRAFEEFKCEGIEEYNLDEDSIDEILGREAYLGAEIPGELIAKLEGTTGKIKYHFSGENAFELAGEFKAFLIEKDIPLEIIEDTWEDWNKLWREHYNPIAVSEHLKIIPILDADDTSKREPGHIYIYPGMGFGTGTHETTFLCLKIFDELNLKPKTCLDFGCGSGILGVAALKLTDATAIFCDVDREALDNCKKNLYLNFEEDRLDGSEIILRERLKDPSDFDLVFANILENILLAEKEVIISSIRPGGFLIVSGLLKDQEQNFLENFDLGGKLKKIKTEVMGDWCAILFEAIG